MRRLKVFIWILAAWVGVLTFSTHLFFWRLEHRLGLKVDRKPFLVLLPGSIRLDPVSLDWQGYLSVQSGSLKIRYPLIAIFTGRYPISLEGRNLAVEFGPQLRGVVGNDEVVFSHLKTRVIVGGGRDVEIDFLDAESKTIQFHLNRAPQTQSASIR